MVQPADSVDHVRRELQRRMRLMLTGSATPPVHDPTRVDPGLFGPASSAWRVHADTSMFVGGLRALLLQTLHPLAMAGVADHSDYRHDPLGRLQRTAGYVGITTYGTTAEAKAMIARVRKIHTRVTGIAPDGRPYDARDPRLLGWVHVTEVDSFLAAYQRYGSRRLSPAECDEYLAQSAVIARRLGVVDPPVTVRMLRRQLGEFRAELHGTVEARDAARFLLVEPPLPLAARPPYLLLAAASVALLPAWTRWPLRLPFLPVSEKLLVGPAGDALTGLIRWSMQPEGRVRAE